MQIATVATGNADKTNWPRMRALPAGLPAPAVAVPAKFDLTARFSAGSIADARDGAAMRVSPTWDFSASRPVTADVQYVGHDARRALAAAAARAGVAQLQPADQQGQSASVRTLIGLYRSGTSWVTVPLWFTPGTNDFQAFRPLAQSHASTPDARFTFRDDRLAAVVSTDGFIATPMFAAAFPA